MSDAPTPNVTIIADLRHGDSGAEGADAVLGESGKLPCVLEIAAEIASTPKAAALYAGSGEITNRALIESAALWGLPLLLDTTGATLKEATRAVGWHQLAFRSGEVARITGPLAALGPLCLLHGVVGDAPWNLRALTRMQGQTFVPVGLVDTSPNGLAAPAIALGARVLLRRPPGLADYAEQAHQAAQHLGQERKLPDASEAAPTHALRRRIVAARAIAAGEVLASQDLAADRPGPGEGEFAPFQAGSVIGRRVVHAIARGKPIAARDLDGAMPEGPAWFAPRPPKQRPE